jgi:hypothetical protein
MLKRYITCFPRHILIKEREMGGACNTYGLKERYVRGFDEETRGKEPLVKT